MFIFVDDDDLTMRRRSAVSVLSIFLGVFFTLGTVWLLLCGNEIDKHVDTSSYSRPTTRIAAGRKASSRLAEGSDSDSIVASHRNVLDDQGTQLTDLFVRKANASVQELEKRIGKLQGLFDKYNRGLEKTGVGDKVYSDGNGVNGGHAEQGQSPGVNKLLAQSERLERLALIQHNRKKKVPENCRRSPTLEDFTPNLDRKYPVQTDRKLIVVVTTMRSGSSFFGTMFDQSDEILYIFEPFWYLEYAYYPRNWNSLKIELLKSFSVCRFDRFVARTFIKLVSTSFKFARSYSKTLIDPPLCPADCSRNCPPIDVELMNRVCLSKKAIVIKTIRIPDMKLLEHVREDVIANDSSYSGNQPAQLQIIHLVRDPRGIMHSRLKIQGQVEKDYKRTHPDIRAKKKKMPPMSEIVASEAEALCVQTMAHIKLSSQVPGWLHGRYIRIRFEDLARDTYNEMAKLLTLYKLNITDSLRKWIQWNTQGTSPGGYAFGTRRKSADVPQKWREMLGHLRSKQYVQLIEERCSTMMKTLGYIPEFPQ